MDLKENVTSTNPHTFLTIPVMSPLLQSSSLNTLVFIARRCNVCLCIVYHVGHVVDHPSATEVCFSTLRIYLWREEMSRFYNRFSGGLGRRYSLYRSIYNPGIIVGVAIAGV